MAYRYTQADGCPFVVDTQMEARCDVKGRPCAGCDWRQKYPFCDWLKDHCCKRSDCPCRECEGANCEDCCEAKCDEVT
jgi:hypothetical protein